ncbi:MAG: glutaredoxin family protein [Dehalococcoidia bacterium]|nr:glutaredoxin family protein [Dehalococcoidia bacterium]
MSGKGAKQPIVYTLATCPTCIKLKKSWKQRGIAFEERQVDENQAHLDEAVQYANAVPIVVYSDGRVEQGFDGEHG